MLDERNALLVHQPADPSAAAVTSTLSISPAGGLRAAFRVLRPLLGDQVLSAASGATALERFARAGDPPTVAGCTQIETGGPRSITSAADSAIVAFLDGIQRSRVIGHLNGSPIIFATVGAAVREREDRQLRTWDAPRIRHLLLAARSHIGESAWKMLEQAQVSPIDVTDLPLHPLAVRTRALDIVADERERLERRLAAEWCQLESRWLWVDGGISGNLAIEETSPAFGVVKSHSTLYGDADALHTTLRLTTGQRSALFLVQHRGRRAVASWYLRLHTSADGDPLHGLVRVEVAPPASLFAPDDLTQSEPDQDAVRLLQERADSISAWILAERKPVALPDPRWDTLTYGVYACEQFLKALIGP